MVIKAKCCSLPNVYTEYARHETLPYSKSQGFLTVHLLNPEIHPNLDTVQGEQIWLGIRGTRSRVSTDTLANVGPAREVESVTQDD